MDKNYNYQRKKLMLPEYGRHVHEMVDYLITITDRELRNTQARVVIEVMGNLNPVLRDASDFKHKLWDHLFIISDFMLDVDSPYPLPTAEMLTPIPDKIPYPNKKITRKQYGKHIEKMLQSAGQIPDEVSRKIVAVNIAHYMRTKSFEYNHEYSPTKVLLNDMRIMSKNGIILDELDISEVKNEYKQPQNSHRLRKNNLQNLPSSSKTSQRLHKKGVKRRGNNRLQNKSS